MIELTYDDYVFDRGAFRQRNLAPMAKYDNAYLDYYRRLDPAATAALDRLRLGLLEALVPEKGQLLDFGCGVGHFIEAALASHWEALGWDVVPGPGRRCPEWALHTRGRNVVAFFDSLEHLPDPAGTIEALAPRWLMVSLPWCHLPDVPEWFMGWHHRKPGEHLWHFSRQGLRDFLGLLGYECVLEGCPEDAYRHRRDTALPNILTAIYRRA